MTTYLLIDSYAGRSKHPVEIVRETPKRYVVRLLEETPLPGRNRWGKVGDEIKVPKYAITERTTDVIH